MVVAELTRLQPFKPAQPKKEDRVMQKLKTGGSELGRSQSEVRWSLKRDIGVLQ